MRYGGGGGVVDGSPIELQSATPRMKWRKWAATTPIGQEPRHPKSEPLERNPGLLWLADAPLMEIQHGRETEPLPSIGSRMSDGPRLS